MYKVETGWDRTIVSSIRKTLCSFDDVFVYCSESPAEPAPQYQRGYYYGLYIATWTMWSLNATKVTVPSVERAITHERNGLYF